MLRSGTVLALCCAVLAACTAGKHEQTHHQQSPGHAPINLTAGPAVSQEMTEQVARQDALLFASTFDNCNAEKVAELVADDFEFYHDKWGLTASSKQQFVEATAGMCKRIQEGTDFRARRELVAGSMRVYPLNNYGAVQTGVHRFYALIPNGPDRLTETAQFTHIWKNENGVWKLARVISFDHQLAP